MKPTKIFSLILFFALVGLVSCKVKDADLQASITEKFKASADLSSLSVEVKEGVVTITGEAKDEATQKLAEEVAKGVKGVKSVVNSSTLPPPPAPVVIATEDELLKGIKDATKDLPSVTASVADSIITLTGEIKKAELPKLMQVLHSLKPKKIENKLTVK